MKLIIGLGNPGLVHANNRHNLGFMCLRHFARAHNISLDRKQGKARIGIGNVAGNKVIVARPQTYMNRSGESVSLLAEIYKLSLDDIFVIHDDLDLPLGKIRIRKGGSSAGHKGIASIIAELGSSDFIRIRVGIGHPSEASENEVVDWVLSNFTPEEKRTIDEVIPKVGEAILCLLREGLTVAMNKYN